MTDLHELKQRAIVLLSRSDILKRLIDSVHRARMQRARRQLHSDGYQVCQEICRALNKKGVICFAISGTLLGLVREGGFIKYDDDIDLAVIVDANFDWNIVQRAMEAAGMALWREFGFDGEVTEQAYRYGNLGVDLFAVYLNKDNTRMYFYTYVNDGDSVSLKVKYLDQPTPGKIEAKPFHNFEINIPENASGLLEANYGPEWRVPDPNFVAGSHWQLMDSSNCFVRYKKQKGRI